MSLLIELDPDSRQEVGFSDLGLLENQAKLVSGLVEKPTGVVLVASPPMQGQSTLLYGVVREHDAYINSVVCFDRVQETNMEGWTSRPIRKVVAMRR